VTSRKRFPHGWRMANNNGIYNFLLNKKYLFGSSLLGSKITNHGSIDHIAREFSDLRHEREKKGVKKGEIKFICERKFRISFRIHVYSHVIFTNTRDVEKINANSLHLFQLYN